MRQTSLQAVIKLLFPGGHNYRNPVSENIINEPLRVMGYDIHKDVFGHGFRTMAL